MKKMLSLLVALISITLLADDAKPLKITSISLFRSEVQFEKPLNLRVEVGNKILAQSYTQHKCLLIVTQVSGNKVTTDASYCPGFCTLKKGDTAQLVSQDEVNEEVQPDSPAAL
jgi:hypothetical protein